MCAQKVGARIVIGRYGYKSSFGAKNDRPGDDCTLRSVCRVSLLGVIDPASASAFHDICVMCHVSCVMCVMCNLTFCFLCYVSCVTCYLSFDISCHFTFCVI